jgi:hypothetical protein
LEVVELDALGTAAEVAMTLGRGIASRPWNAVGNFGQVTGAAEVIDLPAAA